LDRTPLVTVVVPTFNRGAAIRPTIESVLAQSCRDWELIAVDDGSTDDTPSILARWGDPRLRIVRQENRGAASARRRGLEDARGAYLAFLDHDDRWDPEKLRLQTEYLDAHPECGLVYGPVVGTDDTGRNLGAVSLPDPEGDVFDHLLAHGNFLFTMSNPMMRTELVRHVGGPDQEAGLSDDWDLFLRLARVTRFGRIDRPLVRYNFGATGQQTCDFLAVLASEEGMGRRWRLPEAGLTPRQRRLLLRGIRQRLGPAGYVAGCAALRARDLRRARGCYAAALRLHPAGALRLAVLRDLASLVRKSLALGPRMAGSPRS
jgi:glycosyltransferase involved in cell wall biosynthesis